MRNHHTFQYKIKGFIDIIGAFPHKSSRINLYVMVMYEYDSNAILSEPIKNRQAAAIRDFSLKFHNVLRTSGSEPEFYIMENEWPRETERSEERGS